MKTFISYLAIVTFLFSFINLLSARAELIGPVETVEKFFEVSQMGDIESIKSLIAGRFYNNRKALLEKNQDYGKYLKQYYENITLRILRADIQNLNGFATVFVSRQFSNGKELNTELVLKRDENGIWKIYDEILEE